MSFIFKKCFVEYLLLDYEPATPDLIKFYSRSLKRKIKLLQQAYVVKEFETKDIFTPNGKKIIKYDFCGKSLKEIEKKCIKSILEILNENQPIKGFMYWRLKPKFEKHKDSYRLTFRLAIE